VANVLKIDYKCWY